uniref:Uncharacterized protein n=1 Tax=viral metagenome TaxID=1070528 RepID=A0A6C0HH72_9ZZZZ
MKHLQFTVTVFLIIIFFIGIYVYSSGKLDALFSVSQIEGMTMEGLSENSDYGANCPDVLIRQGNKVLLYNSRIPVVKDLNPLIFSNLDEYIDFTRNERTKGNNCPVLFLQHETDIQGNDVYRVRPNLFDLQPGLPIRSAAQIAQNARNPAPIIDANTDHPPYNAGQYAGFDPLGLSVGVFTKLDAIHQSTITQDGSYSDNPMDPNWGGVLYTQQKIQSGKYDDNNVYKPNLLTVHNTQFNAGQFGHESPPNQLITTPHY